MKQFRKQAKLDNLHDMLQFVEENAQSMGFAGRELNKIILSAEEVLTNVIKYAYPKQPDNEEVADVEIECESEGDGELALVIKDRGIPFNPLVDANEVDYSTLPLEDRPIGKLGVTMIKRFMDNVEYHRVEDANVLKMMKKKFQGRK